MPEGTPITLVQPLEGLARRDDFVVLFDIQCVLKFWEAYIIFESNPNHDSNFELL